MRGMLSSYLFIEKVKNRLGGRLIAFSHEILPARESIAEDLYSLFVTYQALPKFMVPRQRGETRTAADGDKSR